MNVRYIRTSALAAVLAIGVALSCASGLWAAQDLLVGVGGNTIQRYTYNTTTSAWDLVGNFVTGTGVWDFCYGPDQNGDGYPELYVSDNGAGVIRWYDGKTGGTSGTTYATATGDEPCGIAFVGDTLYVALDKPNTVVKRNSSGTLETVVSDFYDPRHLTAGPDRTGDGVEDLYIAGGDSDTVNEDWLSRVRIYGYYPGTGWQSQTFTTDEPGEPGTGENYNYGVAWGPDKTGDGVGDLYTADGRRKVIEIMDGVTGAYWGDLTAGFGFPFHLLWGPDGNLYINDYFAEVAIHDITGAKIGFITASANLGLAFMPAEATLAGQIQLDEYSGDLSLAPIKVDLLQSGQVVLSNTIKLTSNPGSYEFTVPTGTYDVRFSGCQWLSAFGTPKTVTITQGGATQCNVVLTNGDVDGDSEITTTDVSVAVQSSGQTGN